VLTKEMKAAGSHSVKLKVIQGKHKEDLAKCEKLCKGKTLEDLSKNDFGK
jgi:hypothetical protein